MSAEDKAPTTRRKPVERIPGAKEAARLLVQQFDVRAELAALARKGQLL